MTNPTYPPSGQHTPHSPEMRLYGLEINQQHLIQNVHRIEAESKARDTSIASQAKAENKEIRNTLNKILWGVAGTVFSLIFWAIKTWVSSVNAGMGG